LQHPDHHRDPVENVNLYLENLAWQNLTLFCDGPTIA